MSTASMTPRAGRGRGWVVDGNVVFNKAKEIITKDEEVAEARLTAWLPNKDGKKELRMAKLFGRPLEYAVADTDTVEKLSKKLELCDKVVRLEIEDTPLTPEDLKTLVPGVRNMVKMENISLVGDNIVGEAAAHLVPMMEKMTKLQSIDVSGNNLGADGVKALSPLFQKLPNLLFVHIGQNNLDSASAIAMAEALHDMPNLVALDLGGIEIDVKAAEALKPALVKWGDRDINGIHFKLPDLRITSVAAAKIFGEALSSMRVLSDLDIPCDDMSPDVAKALGPFIARIASRCRITAPAVLRRAAGLEVTAATILFLKVSTVWQIADLITDIIFIAIVIFDLYTTPGPRSSVEEVTVWVGSFLLLWAILIGGVPFARGRRALASLWNGTVGDVIAYKVYSLFEGGIEILVLYAVRNNKGNFGTIDFVFIGGTLVLLLFDLRFVVKSLLVKNDMVPLLSLLALAPFVALPAAGSRYIQWDYWPILLLGIAYCMCTFWSSLIITADEESTSARWIGLEESDMLFVYPGLRLLYILLAGPLVIPLLRLVHARKRAEYTLPICACSYSL